MRPINVRITGKTKSLEYDFRVIRKDKKIRWVTVLGSHTIINHKPAIIGTVIDITDRKQLETLLQESEIKYRTLVENALVGVYIIQDNRFRYVNKSFSDIFSYTPEEVMEKHESSELVYYADRNIVKENIRKRISGKKDTIEYEFRGLKKDGSIIHIKVLGTLMVYQKKPAIAGTLIDITNKKKSDLELEKYRKHLELLVKKRTNELQISLCEIIKQKEDLQKTITLLNNTRKQLVQSEKMASLGLLAAGLAHEINNPLNFIHLSSQALRSYLKENTNSNINEIPLLLDAIDEGVKRAAQIVISLNHYSRQDSLSVTECDLHSIIDHCLIILQNQVTSQIEIINKYTSKDHSIKGHEGKLHQAFLSILSNAEQSINKKGTIKIHTTVKNDHLIISIEDSGKGIPPEEVEKIFDPFYTTKSPGKGTGLGLFITFNIITEHNGTIKCESEINKGTKIIISFPIYPKDGK